jgi:outer membrane immunogenic protein
MTKFLLAGTPVLILASTLAGRAADMPVKAPAAPPTYDWSGFYLGLNVGAAATSYDPLMSTFPNNSAAASVNAAGASQSLRPIGFVGGTQLGYNWQFGHLLAGLEADIDYLHINGATVSPSIPFTTHQAVITSYGDADWVATVRPRIGWAENAWLFYATGGLAVTDINDDFVFTTPPVSFKRAVLTTASRLVTPPAPASKLE